VIFVTFFRKWFQKSSEPLTGAPATRRLKTYSAQSGYVYQYRYEGQRGADYTFSVSADRKTWRELHVGVSAEAIDAWETSHGRTLSSTERYALAKMGLFAAFDDRATPAELGELVSVDDVAGIAENLGFD
jgi:hypothetical protein